MAEEELERTEIEAVLETRRELGPQYDAALVQSFAERIEREVERRAGGEVSARGRDDRLAEGDAKRQFVLGIVSVGAGIPITAITVAVPDGSVTSFGSLLIGWAGIVGVNVAHALGVRRRS